MPYASFSSKLLQNIDSFGCSPRSKISWMRLYFLMLVVDFWFLENDPMAGTQIPFQHRMVVRYEGLLDNIHSMSYLCSPLLERWDAKFLDLVRSYFLTDRNEFSIGQFCLDVLEFLVDPLDISIHIAFGTVDAIK